MDRYDRGIWAIMRWCVAPVNLKEDADEPWTKAELLRVDYDEEQYRNVVERQWLCQYLSDGNGDTNLPRNPLFYFCTPDGRGTHDPQPGDPNRDGMSSPRYGCMTQIRALSSHFAVGPHGLIDREMTNMIRRDGRIPAHPCNSAPVDLLAFAENQRVLDARWPGRNPEAALPAT
jgi:hypothetical protein